MSLYSRDGGAFSRPIEAALLKPGPALPGAYIILLIAVLLLFASAASLLGIVGFAAHPLFLRAARAALPFLSGALVGGVAVSLTVHKRRR